MPSSFYVVLALCVLIVSVLTWAYWRIGAVAWRVALVFSLVCLPFLGLAYYDSFVLKHTTTTACGK
jgi:hypothetical protein